MLWVGGILALAGLAWAVLPHTLHASIVSTLTGVSYDSVLSSSHTVHRIEGVIAFVIGLALFWFGRR